MSNGRHSSLSQTLELASASDTTAGGYERPPAVEWVIAVFAAVVQQGAFVSIPLLLTGSEIDAAELGETPNIFNTIAVAANALTVGILCIVHRRKLLSLARENLASVLLTLIILMSVLWSIHPEISVRRSGTYIVTMLTAAYLAARFSTDEVMRVLSWSTAMSAIGSVLFVAAYPAYGIMQESYVAGDWRGVFPHKNMLGLAMSVGVFVECYILASSPLRNRRHLPLLIGFFVLIVLSQATTSLLCSLLYLIGAGIYLTWRYARSYAFVAVVGLALLGMIGLDLLWVDPDSVLAFLGKDTTLTGRTEIWSIVPKLIAERPLLGWGYRAMWQHGDNATIYVWNFVGWNIPSAHNALLELALQLGLLGVVVSLAIVGVALWRSMRCIFSGPHQLGAFSLLFFLGTIYFGVTDEVVGPLIAWLVFNLLSFRCQLDVSQLGTQDNRRPRQVGRTILSRAKPGPA